VNLVLSLFPGIGMLDMAFEQEGFCVVRGPDVLWGGDIRNFHPPAGRFDGVIGGPPCQEFSRLSFMVKANGNTPAFGNLIPEFERCVRVSRPSWFVMENVPDAPTPGVEGYGIHSFVLNNRQLGEDQNRVRRWSFGCAATRRILEVDTCVFESPQFEYAATSGGGTGSKLGMKRGIQAKGFKSRNSGAWFRRQCELQGLSDEFDLPPFTTTAKCKAVGNGVPLPMGRAIAKAVRKAIGDTP
jgi:DNA (cytosine-5)-methyltransferase 1